MVFHICIYCTLIRLTPFITYFYLLPYSPSIQGLSVHFIMLSSCTDAVDFNITHSLPLIFPPLPHSSPLWRTQYYNHVVCHSFSLLLLCMYVCIYLSIYVYLPTHTYTHIYAYICDHVCTYIYIDLLHLTFTYE
jgi:hypothetical protein